MLNLINNFTGNYDFLSNDFDWNITYDNVIYKNATSAFIAQRFPRAIRHLFRNCSGVKARRIEKKLIKRDVVTRPNWEELKIDFLVSIVCEKFKQSSILTNKLISTGDTVLINTADDLFLGFNGSKGFNALGKCLMKVRKYLIKIKDKPNYITKVKRNFNGNVKNNYKYYKPCKKVSSVKQLSYYMAIDEKCLIWNFKKEVIDDLSVNDLLIIYGSLTSVVYEDTEGKLMNDDIKDIIVKKLDEILINNNFNLKITIPTKTVETDNGVIEALNYSRWIMLLKTLRSIMCTASLESFEKRIYEDSYDRLSREAGEKHSENCIWKTIEYTKYSLKEEYKDVKILTTKYFELTQEHPSWIKNKDGVEEISIEKPILEMVDLPFQIVGGVYTGEEIDKSVYKNWFETQDKLNDSKVYDVENYINGNYQNSNDNTPKLLLLGEETIEELDSSVEVNGYINNIMSRYEDEKNIWTIINSSKYSYKDITSENCAISIIDYVVNMLYNKDCVKEAEALSELNLDKAVKISVDYMLDIKKYIIKYFNMDAVKKIVTEDSELFNNTEYFGKQSYFEDEIFDDSNYTYELEDNECDSEDTDEDEDYEEDAE